MLFKEKQKHNKNIFAPVMLLVAVFLLFQNPSVQASPITEMNVINLSNQARIEKGLVPLEPNDKLFKIAEDKADDMIRNNYFAHTSPSGITPWDWFEKNNYDYKFAGENLAINFSSVENQQKAWMESETHRKNILDSNYSEIGVAVKRGVINGKMTTVVVQEFGLPSNYASLVKNKSNQEEVLGEKNNELVSENSFFLNPRNSLIKNLNSQAVLAKESLSDSMLKNKLLSYLNMGAGLIMLAIVAVINPIIIAWIIWDAAVYFRRKYENTIVALELLSIKPEEYAEFLKSIQVNADNLPLYLKQMKLKR